MTTTWRFNGRLTSEGFTGSVDNPYSFKLGDATITIGRTFTFNSSGGETSVSLGVQGRDGSLGLKIGEQGSWSGEARVNHGGEYVKVGIEVTPGRNGHRQVEFTLEGSHEVLELGGTQIWAEYSLTPEDYQVTLKGLPPEVAEKAKKLAQDIAKAVARGDTAPADTPEQNEGSPPGSKAGVTGGANRGEGGIPEGWFLQLTPQEQKLAIEIIRHRLGVELSRRGIDINSLKLVIGLMEATDNNGNPRTVVAIGLKHRENKGGNMDSKTSEKKKERGGEGDQGADNVGTTQSSGFDILYIDVARGDLSAHLGIDRTQGPEFSLRYGENWGITVTPQGWTLNMGAQEGPLTLSASLGSNSSSSINLGFPLGESRAQLTFTYNPAQGVGIEFQGTNPNGSGVNLSWLPASGLMSAHFYAELGGGLRIFVKMTSNGSWEIGIAPSQEEEK